ncbi:MAG: nitroreductase/quinone reductase family protein [Candidatus Dormibacteria bacterium]
MATIPDSRWGKQDGLFAKIGTAVASTKLGSRAIRAVMPLDRKVLLRTDGRRTVLGPLGAPTMLLETIGRKSGQPRLSPLLFARDGDSIIVVGSNFGQEHHPAWTGNLIAHPEAVVIAGGARVPVGATLLEGEAAEAAYQSMVEVTSVYAEYRHRTDRAIRVFRLTPI